MLSGTALTARRHGDRIEVRLHRDPCNELGTTALAELEQLVGWLENADARAVIFYSDRARGFCAGADLRELQEGMVQLGSSSGPSWRGRAARKLLGPVLRRRVGRFIDRIHDVFDRLDQLPLLTIAVTHGVVFGGGFELALTADVIVAEQNSRFAFPELRLGLVPGFGGIPRLERDVGNAVVRDLLLSGRSLGAKRAHQIGLVSQLVGRGKGLDIARKLAEQAARFEPATVRRAKRFAKPLPRERLDEEKRQFLQMITDPAVLRALTRFVEDDSVRPYLPK